MEMGRRCMLARTPSERLIPSALCCAAGVKVTTEAWSWASTGERQYSSCETSVSRSCRPRQWPWICRCVGGEGGRRKQRICVGSGTEGGEGGRGDGLRMRETVHVHGTGGGGGSTCKGRDQAATWIRTIGVLKLRQVTAPKPEKNAQRHPPSSGEGGPPLARGITASPGNARRRGWIAWPARTAALLRG